MGFEESALARLRRYREEADVSLELIREAEAAARHFSSRLFAGLEYTSVLGRQAGFEIETTYAGGALDLGAVAGPGREAGVSFGVVPGAAAETDEDLMHEELSRYSLEPSGYSGRILAWSTEAGDAPCQTFAVYRDGVWKTMGLFSDTCARAGRRSRRCVERLLPQDPGTPARPCVPLRGRWQTLDGRALRAEGPPRRPSGPDDAALAEITVWKE